VPSRGHNQSGIKRVKNDVWKKTEKKMAAFPNRLKSSTFVPAVTMSLKAGVNTYAYVLNQPLIAIDSFGLASVLPPLNPDKALDGLVKDRGPSELGMLFGEACASHCTRMKNPRRDPSDVATEICDELLPPLYIGRPEGHKIMLSCRSHCLKRYTDKCPKDPAACLSPLATSS